MVPYHPTIPSLHTIYHHLHHSSQSTNLSKIVYAGWLYKRSNEPIVSPTNVGLPNNEPRSTPGVVPELPFSSSTTNATNGLFTEPSQPPLSLTHADSQNESSIHTATDYNHVPSSLDASTTTPNTTEKQADPLRTTPAWQFLCTLLDIPKDWQQLVTETNGVLKHSDDPTGTTDPAVSRLSSSPIPVPASQTRPPARRIHSQSEQGSAEDWQPAEDIIDADGHVWRARYCVLEDGVLYFYRHKADAESSVAVAERQDDSETAADEEAVLLQQQSPPRAGKLSSSFLANYSGSILSQSPRIPKARTHVWEKRLGLVFVGSVRSAEAQYGAHTLELSSLESDNEDCLILRARNADEMGEWFFQLHRSLEVWFKNIMTTSLWHDVGEVFVPETASAWLSPRIRPSETAVPLLSHGHGRSSLNRQRVAEDNDSSLPVMPDDVSPETPLRVTTTIPFMPQGRTGDYRIPNETPLSVDLRPSTPPVFELEEDFLSPEQTAPPPPETEHPAPPKLGKYIPPHLRQKAVGKRYVPPHLRKQSAVTTGGGGTVDTPTAKTSLSLAERLARDESKGISAGVSTGVTTPFPVNSMTPIGTVPAMRMEEPLVMGGCADPNHVHGSVLDARYVPRKASKLYRTAVRPFGYAQSPRWEIGAVSECGAREANEDAYLIVGDLWKAFATMENAERETSLEDLKLEDSPGLFCVFDGHCGDQAARFAAEKFTKYLHGVSQETCLLADQLPSEHVEELIRKAVAQMDTDFCNLSVQDGRAWESGATALIAALFDDDLVIANLGDARGVLSRSVDSKWEGLNGDPGDEGGDWLTLVEDEEYESLVRSETAPRRRCVYRHVTQTHSPARDEERLRIEQCNGWITMEKEIPVSQAHRLDLHDELARDILNRALTREDGGASAPHRLIQIGRVCGELAVSRALGDRDFKALSDPDRVGTGPWQGSGFLPYPENHSRYFHGDLVSNIPDVQSIRVRQSGFADEFLLLACDGLWDVMDADDAVRVTRRLLLDENWPVRQAAARLAKLAMHLGSSDNITVLIVRVK